MTNLIRQMGMAVGAEVAHCLLKYLDIQVSGDTVLRILRHFGTSYPLDMKPRIIGVDDWALKRGKTYGTIIVNLETHQVVDLLPDRTAETLANWLQQHPDIELVSRDRSTDYAAGIRQGSPQAVQVADRWHLLLNLRQMMERYLATRLTVLQQLPISETYQVYLDQQRPAFLRTNGEIIASNKQRDERVAFYQQVQQMRQEGWNISQLTRELQRHPATIRKYYYATTFPERSARRSAKSMLDPYLSYLEKRVLEGCENGQQLWRELQQQGYPGTDRQVMKWLQLNRTQVAPTTPHSKHTATRPSRTKATTPSAKQLAWLLVRDANTLSELDAMVLAHVRQDQQLDSVYTYIHRFITMVKQRLPLHFDAWLQDVNTIPVYPLQTFVIGLRQDYAAVYAALALTWSNGQTEGQVNRLKFIKRQMYGRAKFDLLRLRVLAPP